MIINVLGPGCHNCQKLEANVKEAIKYFSIDIEIQKVTKINEIASYGIIRTPGLVINSKIKSQGKIPDIETIKQWINEEWINEELKG